MILLPNKEYSQRLLDELNCIGYRFLESATEYLIDEDDEEYLAQELEWFFPEHLVNQDMQRCLDTLKTPCRWMESEAHYYPVTRLHEYLLMQAIHHEWLFFNDIPEEESQKLREAFYSPSGNVRLSEMEESLINEMENSELLTMDAFFESVNFGELELIASFDQKPLFTFLRF